MKSTGIVRQLDQLGRIVIPKELRTTFDLKEKDPVQIFVEGEDIILREYQPACIFCSDAADMVVFEGKNVCRSCLKKLKGID